MKIYLSLPITGYDIEERKEYAAGQVKVLEGIYPDSEVYNPLSLVDGHDYTYARYMGLDMAELADSDMIVFCPDFNKSQGCMTEFWFALKKEMPMQFIDDEGRVRHDDVYMLSVKDESEKKEQPTEERQAQKVIDNPYLSDHNLKKYPCEFGHGGESDVVYHAKRFGMSTKPMVVQSCLNAYDQRIEELTEQCNELNAVIKAKDGVIEATAGLSEDELSLINEIRLGRFRTITISKEGKNYDWIWTSERPVEK